MGKFDGEFADRSLTYAGTARLRYAWWSRRGLGRTEGLGGSGSCAVASRRHRAGRPGSAGAHHGM